MKKNIPLTLIVTIVFLATFYVFSFFSKENSKSRILGVSDSTTSVGLYVGSPEITITVETPANLRTEARSGSEIRISWEDKSNNEEGFRLERKKEGGSFSFLKNLSANSTSTSDTNLDPETKYTYRMLAYFGSINSNYSNESSATTDIPKAKIENVQGECDSLSVDLSVDNYYENENLDFRVRIKNLGTGEENETSFENLKVGSDGRISLGVFSLNRNSQYEVSVRFKYILGYSDWSSREIIETSGCEVIVITPEPEPIDPPQPELIEPQEPESIIPSTPYQSEEQFVSEKTIKEKEENRMASILKNISKKSEEISRIVEEEKEVVTATSVVSASLAGFFVVSQLHSFADFGALLKSLWGFILGFFAVRRRGWGVVFDNQSGKPISMATVSIYNKENKRVDSRVTDRYGAYSFLIPPGEYYLEIKKEGYKFEPQTLKEDIFYAGQYGGEKIESDKHNVVKKDVPMKPEKEIYEKALRSFKLKKVFSYGFFAFGFAFSFGAFIFNPSKINFAICSIYILSAALSYAMAIGSRWGSVLGLSGQPEAFATLKIFEKETGALKARTISDEKGRYFVVLDPGSYNMEISTVSGIRKNEDFSVAKRGVLNKYVKIMA